MRRQLAVAALLVALVVLGGCAARVDVGYRTYDPYYHDYHVWTDAELPHFNAWIAETHHSNVEFAKLPNKDRQNYWRWRHDHPDHR